MRGILPALFALCSGACAAALPEPTSADSARRSALVQPSDLAELQQGRSLYLARCGTCHALRDPQSLRPSAWLAEVRDMRVEKGVRLSDEEARRISAYLVAISSRQSGS